MDKNAMYPGSFNPFTNGHLDVILRAAPLYDKFYIVIAINPHKDSRPIEELEEMRDAIQKTLDKTNLTNCEVVIWVSLIANFAFEYNVKYVIRGLRNITDYDYEENIRNISKELNPALDYIYIPHNFCISSTAVREFIKYDVDITPYVPQDIKKLVLKWRKNNNG